MDREPKSADPSTLAFSRLSFDGPHASIATMSQVYARVAQLLGVGAVRSEGPGYRLFWSAGGDLQWKDIGATEDSYAIVGRHSKCDVRLAGDDALSLRHLLVRPVTIDGALALAVLDLRGGLPFFLDDDTPHRSILANGPLALRLGGYVLCAIPLGAGGDLAFNRSQPTPAVRVPSRSVERSVAPSYRVGSAAELSQPPPAAAHTSHSTRLTLRRGISSIEELRRVDQPGSVRLVVSSGDRTVTVALSSDDLAEGVLVGRSDRCIDRGIARILSSQISRAHLLIVETGGRVEAFDLCSTNGTRNEKQRVRRLVLPDRGATLRLGAHVTIAYSRVG